MIAGGPVELLLGVNAEGKSLEEVATPLTAVEASKGCCWKDSCIGHAGPRTAAPLTRTDPRGHSRAMEIDELTPAELQVWQAFPRGTEVDFRTAPGEEATAGSTWGPERTLRAEVLRTLLLNGPRTAGETAVLKVTGARITGRLDLQYATVDCPVHLWACYFEEEVDLYGAQLRRLSLGVSVLPSLHATSLRLDDSLRMTLCRVRGPVRLAGARITGAVFLDRARIGEPAQESDDAPAPPGTPAPPAPNRRREDVLQLNGAVIEDHLSARGLTVHGTFRVHGTSIAGTLDLDEARLDCPAGTALRGTRLAVGSDLKARYLTANGELCLKGAAIAGTLDLSDSRLDNPTDTTLHASTLSVGADLHAMRLVSNGRINLRGARIPGQLNFAHASLANPGGMALRASSLVAGELWFREARPIRGTVSLRRAQLDLLHITPATWPDEVRLDGLTYTTLAPHEPAERRLALLWRDKDGHIPFSYEQLTTAYRRIGDDGAARTVQLAKQRRHRSTLPPYARLWGYVQDAAVGYGFRPVRAAAWLFSLLLIGTLAYTAEHPRALKPDEAPAFNALVYTLDLLLPIIDFGQESAYTPTGTGFQWLAYALIITGWVLATTIAAGVTRTISRQ
ncbi:membrane-associated oxidoreductase [Streptomyces sp. NBC_01304]|uniref:membrane-associated oxidoreductase n=1 Tax=Streptomyces sp. NBC_01304 TaxID=2903818 RepID=UPI002E119CA8|nr:membrane-associated oxidoreductase [Streptomyces sp. NBC_01304]